MDDKKVIVESLYYRGSWVYRAF